MIVGCSHVVQIADKITTSHVTPSDFFFLPVFHAEEINLKSREEQQQSSPARLSGFGVFGRNCRSQFCFIMSSDEIVWQVINQQFCSYKLK